jgi:hypothetical protein
MTEPEGEVDFSKLTETNEGDLLSSRFGGTVTVSA